MLDKDVVPTLLSIATPSSESGTDEEWELTLRFASEHREQNLAEIIFQHTTAATDPRKVGALIDHLIWNISDESLERMMQTFEAWLCADDPRKISYVLAMDYVFPFKDTKQMYDVLSAVKSKWPEFSERCDELIERRTRLVKKKL